MVTRRQLAVGAASLAALGALAVPLGLTQGTGKVDVFVGSTPTPTSTPPPGSPTTANIWVDQNGGTCLDSGTAVAYSDAAACSFDGANDTCDNGDTVLVKGGTSYGAVTLTGSNGRTADCTIYNATGENVVLGDLNNGRFSGGDTGADYLHWIGETANCRYGGATTCSFRMSEWANDFTTNNTYEGVDMDADGNGGAGGNTTQPCHFEAGGSITMKNSRIHNGWNSNALCFMSGNGPFLFEDVDIYGALNDTDGLIHEECIYASSVANITLRRVRIFSCATQTLFVTGSGDATNWLIENSVIESPLGPNDSGLVFRGPVDPSPNPDGFTIRNSTIMSMNLDDSGNNIPTANGLLVENSYFVKDMPCGQANSVLRYNVTSTGQTSCGTGSQTFSLASINAGFVSSKAFSSTPEDTFAAPGDWHLVTGSPLLAAGNTLYAPAVDLDGCTRPGTPSAGAYELGTLC